LKNADAQGLESLCNSAPLLAKISPSFFSAPAGIPSASLPPILQWGLFSGRNRALGFFIFHIFVTYLEKLPIVQGSAPAPSARGLAMGGRETSEAAFAREKNPLRGVSQGGALLHAP
jgi:hypothetical protein